MRIALFGEAEKGAFRTPTLCRNLDELEHKFGQPPTDSKGLYFAIQSLLFNKELLFFRVAEEGYSRQDYLNGIEALKDLDRPSNLTAIGLPGVGDAEIIEASLPLCLEHQSLLIFTEGDLYDYLTSADW